MNAAIEIDDKVLPSHHLAVALIDLCLMRGIEPHKLLKGTQIFYEDLAQPESKISAAQLFKLIANSQKSLNSHDISFMLGRLYFPGNLGAIANLLLNCRDLAHMLKMMLCFQAELFPLLCISRQQHQQQTHIIFNHALGWPPDNVGIFIAELICSVITSTIKWRYGHSLPIRFKFPYAKPQYIEQYQVNLGDDLHFEQHIFMLSINTSDLHRPFADSSKTLKRHYLYRCQQTRIKRVGLVHQLLLFLTKNSNSSLEQSAAYLHISPSTLKRKLKQHHCSFQQLLDLVKKQQAVYQIAVLGDNNDCVARSLSFTDANNFRRAFKRWTGITPSQLRNT